MNNNQEDEAEEEEQERELEHELARREWDFDLCTAISSRAQEVSDVLGAIEIDPSGRLLATGGIARKIRIYSFLSLLQNDIPASLDHAAACDFYICTPAKLSSLAWRGSVVGAGDYDGVVTEYDLERRIAVFERDEHGGRRVWSVDYSASGDLAASGSDDGAAHIWDTRSAVSIGSLNACAPVCSVEFEKQQGVYIGLGCADKCGYVYDLRNLSGPLSVFSGHRKTVTYVRFARSGWVVTSSVDGCHRLWDVDGREVRAYRGHRNARSFVGMAVCKGGGLIGCGSESNEVFVYDLRWGDPIWVRQFGSRDDEDGVERGFVSAVCWREVSENECALVAGGSNGVVQIFAGRRKF